MPRPKKIGGPEPKKRSRTGCWPCKHKKVKCGEEKPTCVNCVKQGEKCDYSIRLNWEGRAKRKADHATPHTGGTSTKGATPGTTMFATSKPPLMHASGSSTFSAHHSAPFSPGPSTSGVEYPDPTDTLDEDDGMTESYMGSPDIGSLHFMSSTPPPFTAHHSGHPSPTTSDLPLFQGNFIPPPPRPASADGSSFGWALSQNRIKRMRHSLVFENDLHATIPSSQPRHSSCTSVPSVPQDQNWQIPPHRFAKPSSLGAVLPPTPSASSITSDDAWHPLKAKQSPPTQPVAGDLRKLSVSSLLSSPAKEEDNPMDSRRQSSISSQSGYPIPASLGTGSYGIDRGIPDIDIPKNDDFRSLDVLSPPTQRLEWLSDGDEETPELFTEFGFGLTTNNDSGYYYSQPKQVIIPMDLQPLPPILRQNPINLMYFHHFLNHTASILVPHDCSENPFRNILPQMALQSLDLMHLLLAYSASHRARLLQHPEPANRIAYWVRDVFPNLRHALLNQSGQISNASLATAIMLASLEIISPGAFDVPIPWQTHLNTARGIILAKNAPRSVHRRDKVSYFLMRWFAYLDVVGALSGGKNDQPLFSGDYFAQDDLDATENEFQVDCLLGFTSRLIGILARIAELARCCDSERIKHCQVDLTWRPSDEVVAAAENLKAQLQVALSQKYEGCPHERTSSTLAEDHAEMEATNQAFHWAGRIHLDRRIMGRAPEDPEVQFAVRRVVDALGNIRQGGTAEACVIFPMFTAGCDALDKEIRTGVRDRMKRVEDSGMTQVHKARTLMERSWELGRPWETLVQGEFFG